MCSFIPAREEEEEEEMLLGVFVTILGHFGDSDQCSPPSPFSIPNHKIHFLQLEVLHTVRRKRFHEDDE